jgi:hypothetical protein
MPTDEERLKSAQLRLVTQVGADDVRAAAGRAQQAGKRTISNSIKVKSEGPSHIDYSIRGPGGVVEQLAFSLSWEVTEASTVVVTQVGKHLTARSTMFGIPYGARKVPALRSFEQFSEWMRKELAR